jgi:hypothetical protein
MIFDVLCKLVEIDPSLQNHKQLLDNLRSTKLFIIDSKLPETISEDTSIILPYENMAFEFKVLAGNPQVMSENCVVIDHASEDRIFYILSTYPNPNNLFSMEKSTGIGIIPEYLKKLFLSREESLINYIIILQLI